jgi:hypothetical protein
MNGWTTICDSDARRGRHLFFVRRWETASDPNQSEE